MRKATIFGGLGLYVVALLALTVYVFANAPEAGSMGVWGYVANAEEAQLEVAEQPAAQTLVVERVRAPEDAWIVVHVNDDGMPGERVGLQAIPAGESRDVEVLLTENGGPSVIVAVHADRAGDDEFDFDMEDAERSADRPFFVDGMELATVVTFR